MSQLHIAHLSDLHVLRDYQHSMFDRPSMRQTVPPVHYFLSGLQQAVASRPDVIVLTGDLVHEGTEEDYRYLHDLIQRYSNGIPVLPVLGNHDLKQCFYQGYLGEERTGRYFYKYERGGYRFLILDTATERNGCGDIPDQQIDWLEEELRHPAEHGTILLGHHPLETRQAWFHTTYSPRLGEVLSGSDVIAYLCGHAHYAEVRTVLGMPQITAESFAFGVETVSPTEVIYTHTRGYQDCFVEGNTVAVHPRQLFPFSPEFYRFAF